MVYVGVIFTVHVEVSNDADTLVTTWTLVAGALMVTVPDGVGSETEMSPEIPVALSYDALPPDTPVALSYVAVPPEIDVALS